MELAARLVTAAISFKVGSYAVAVAGDAVAWLSTGIFSWVLYLFVLKTLRKQMNVLKQA